MKRFLPTLLSLIFLISSFQLLVSIRPTSSQAQTQKDCGNPDSISGYVADAACTTVFNEDTCKFLACMFEVADNQPQGPWYDQNLRQFQTKVFNQSNPNEIFGERYTQAQINWTINSLLSLLLPRMDSSQSIYILIQVFGEIQKKLLSGTPVSFGEYAQLGPMGIFASIANFTYANPVASTKDEVIRLGQNFKIVPSAYAQGVGFNKLGAGNIRLLWSASRNAAYLISIILLIAGGFAIMFRAQINPQTVVSIQMIIPKLAISLVLITFSYAIVGFVVDMIYVVIAAFLGFLTLPAIGGGSILSVGNLPNTINTLTNAGTLSFVAWFLLIYILFAIIMLLLLVGTQAFLGLVGGLTIPLVPAIAGLLSPILVPILLIMVGLFVWSIYVAVRIVAQLVMAYLHLILLTIVGPLQIMLDIYPSKTPYGFVPWIKCVIGNASVFVSYAVLSVIAIVLLHQGNILTVSAGLNFNVNTAGSSLFTLPFFGGVFGQRILTTNIIYSYIIGLGYFSMVPNLVSGIKNALCKVAEPSAIEEKTKELIQNITKGAQEGGTALGKIGGELIKPGTPPTPPTAPACLGKTTPISTPLGYVAVNHLKVGDPIWTFAHTGEKTEAKVAKINATPVANHKALLISFKEGESVLISPLHPLPSGTPVNTLSPEQKINGKTILDIKLVNYTDTHVYDILPDGKTGLYEASGLILASTLKQQTT